MKIEKIKISDQNEIANCFENIFLGKVDDVLLNSFVIRNYYKLTKKKLIGFKAIENGEIVGFSIFENYSIFDFSNDFNYINYKNKSGLMGIAMGIMPNYQRKGYGSLLINKSMKLNYDYIWGGNAKSLNNIGFWKKYRMVVGEDEKNYITLIDIK